MLRRTLNLGILAHVDAGKTTLTERLLHAAGVIDEIGSVDHGTTRTDSLPLERQRGITIKSAVVSFAIDDVTVNLIDTPGHPDFIAEVERVLSVLDGAVLVISAVEGVQPQTRLLMRALQRLHVATLFFVNKVDRAGASEDWALQAISERLTPSIVPMGSVLGVGSRDAEFVPGVPTDVVAAALAEHDEAILAAYVDGDAEVSSEQLGAQTKQALVHPVFFGSALTGAGVEALMTGIAELLPAKSGDADGPASATVFKVERGPAGEKIAYVRMFSGRVRTRDRVRFGHDTEGKVTAVRVFEDGSDAQRPSLSAGEIGKLWGLADIRIGDAIGRPGPTAVQHHFAPPTLETVVVPRNPEEAARLHVALGQLAEQDPLIDVRRDDDRRQLSISLYGEVQKEVIQATLADDYDLDVDFSETTTICIERPAGTGEAVEMLNADPNPFRATIGLRVDPAPAGSEIEFRLRVDPRTVPLYVYRTAGGFAERMDEYVRDALREGLFGWQVTDCVVTMTRCGYSVPDGPPSRRGPLSTAADFRKLTPIVLMRALDAAGSEVCEPFVRLGLEIPTGSIGAVMSALARLGASVETPSPRGKVSTIESLLPAARVNDLQRQLPGLTGGEGVLESEFDGYRPVAGQPQTRRRTTPDPRNREEYLLRLARRVGDPAQS